MVVSNNDQRMIFGRPCYENMWHDPTACGSCLADQAAEETPTWVLRLEGEGKEVRRLKLPASEVVMHLGLVDKEVWAYLYSRQMVQLVDDDGKEISFPIGRGEAGWDNPLCQT